MRRRISQKTVTASRTEKQRDSQLPSSQYSVNLHHKWAAY